ncbi:MAG: DUF2997 domain-containing protein, partial [Deltaproteobacteria bacterium]|nr:DUF2997 domain-containing protein [Deltaproteobacteria bacterium]
DGNVKVNVFGAAGKGCLDLTRELETLLGGDVVRELTSEYYQNAEVRETEKVKTST